MASYKIGSKVMQGPLEINHHTHIQKFCSPYALPRGDHSHTKVVRMLVTKNGVKGSIFGLVAASTFSEKRVLFRVFRLNFDV